MAADGLAPCNAMPSAAMVLDMQDKLGASQYKDVVLPA